ncbi:MAG: divalent-cation tolerance protein CutA [Desulfovibrio sp.]|jgi:periplasmic divalent cation tolerance protein|nr:divalent-cation tolerance protein CutA [Desulfovibrio sp.]
MNALIVYVTTPDEASAGLIAGALVEERLCAGATVIAGARSVFRWKGGTVETSECVCLLMTNQANYPDLERRVKEMHPYEVPCIAALPVQSAYPPFLQWIEGETRS